MTISPDQGKSSLQRQRIADALALAVVVALPWSISASLVFIALWLIAVIVALRPSALFREILTLAGGTPVLLFLLGALGTMWANVDWAERLGGADTFFKLLAIPLLFAQFRRSDRASWLLAGFLISCTALLALYWATTLGDAIVSHRPGQSAPSVKNATTEISEFIICGFILLFLAITALRGKRRSSAAGMLALAAAFLGFVFYVLALPSRWFTIGLDIVLPSAALLLLLALKQFNGKAMLGLLIGGAIAGLAAYAASPTIRNLIGTDTLVGVSRPVYWSRSVRFIADAPILGHGTGSIRSLFEQAAKGQSGPMGEIATNPFQETLSVGIQLGLIGVAALWAMWIAHLLLFRAEGLADWIGLIIVVYTVAAAMADSELFDSHRGWTYVFGVGIAGGAVLRARFNAQKA